MIQKTFNSLGVDVKINVPETIAEAVEKFGEEIVLDRFVKSVVYHSTLGDFRDGFVSKLEEVTGVARKTKLVDEEEVYAETESEYVKRLVAEEGKEDSSAYQTFADEVSSTLVFEPKAERVSSGRAPSKPGKSYLATAKTALEFPPEKLEKVLTNLRNATGLDVQATEESIAIAIKAKLDADRLAFKASLGV